MRDLIFTAWSTTFTVKMPSNVCYTLEQAIFEESFGKPDAFLDLTLEDIMEHLVGYLLN